LFAYDSAVAEHHTQNFVVVICFFGYVSLAGIRTQKFGVAVICFFGYGAEGGNYQEFGAGDGIRPYAKSAHYNQGVGAGEGNHKQEIPIEQRV